MLTEVFRLTLANNLDLIGEFLYIFPFFTKLDVGYYAFG